MGVSWVGKQYHAECLRFVILLDVFFLDGYTKFYLHMPDITGVAQLFGCYVVVIGCDNLSD